jgi:hypothetical protein
LGDELQGDRLAGLRGAGGPGGGFLSVLCGHLSDHSTKTGGSRARCLLTASVRFVQAGQRRGLHPLTDGSGAGAQRPGAVRNRQALRPS